MARSEPQPYDPGAIPQAAKVLARARSVLFITGAGLSADSGLPTYRGVGGLYEHRDTAEGLPIEELLSGDMMTRRPEVTWKYLSEIEATCRDARPNRGHEVIALAERELERVWVLTQNVDGLHLAAGSRNVIEIHGNLHRLRCDRCDQGREVEDYAEIEIPPRCPGCGGLMRPDVVLFGEALPVTEVLCLRSILSRGFDAVFSVGTTSVFPYIAEPVLLARRMGAATVEINPGLTTVSDWVDIRIPERAAPALEAIWKARRDRRR